MACFSRAFDQVERIGGFRTLDEGHVDVWDKLAAAHRELSPYGYDYFPRGRVNWREADNKFLLLADRYILRRNLQRTIVSRWALPESDTIAMADPHYRTQRLPTLFNDRGIAK